MKETLTRLDRWLAKHRPRFRKNLRPGALPADLSRLEKSLGQEIPNEIQTLLSWHDGQGEDYVGYFVDHWLLMNIDKVIAANQELDVTGEELGWNKQWLPFMDDDGGNYLVLDTSSQHRPLMAFYMGNKTEEVAPSLATWFEEFVRNVEAGKYVEDPERGTFSLVRA